MLVLMGMLGILTCGMQKRKKKENENFGLVGSGINLCLTGVDLYELALGSTL